MPIAVKGAAVTIFGWDASHYDGDLTSAILSKAAAEGIAFFSHKLGEGLANTDPKAVTALAAARDAGIRVIGAYWFVHGNDDPKAEAAQCVAIADRDEPWWRTFPGWFWQTDAETSPTGLPSPTYVKAFSDELARLSGRTVIVYASHGMYGDRLAGLGHPLWNANYPSSRQAPFKDLYPGDTFSGWAPYSGQTPVICQYTSSATIAGLTTCDANAFKGTVAQLLALIGGSMTSPTLTTADAVVLAHSDGVINNTGGFGYRQDSPTHVPPGSNAAMSLDVALQSIAGQAHAANVNAAAALAAVAGLAKSEAALQATLDRIAAGGTSLDTAALAVQIKAVGDATTAEMAALQQTVADLEAKLAAAVAAEAAALAK